MLASSFNVKLDYQIQKGQVVSGKFDGKTPSIAFATSGGKIVLYSPHQQSKNNENSSNINILNFNRTVTALASGNFNLIL